jgi:hypothetical protein
MPVFDNSVNLGHVLTLIGFIGAVIGAFYALKGRLGVIEASNTVQTKLMEGMQTEIKELKNAMIMFGRLDERLIALQREVTELKHGRGFVQPVGTPS